MGVKRVGHRIHVYWTDETAWFTGVVQQFSPSQGYYVLYDDGDERWEGLHESYRFDGQQSDSDEEEEDDADQDSTTVNRDLVVSGTTPRAMEPPRSDDDEDDNSETDGESREGDPTEGLTEDKEEVGDAESDAHDETAYAYPKPTVLRGNGGHEEDENETHSEEDDAHSVALTDVPITYEPQASAHHATANLRGRRALPHRGVLRGVVVRASNLPLVNRAEEPTAFARVAFVEAGSSDEAGGRRQPSTLMLRCKQTLSATQEAQTTSSPIWNDVDESDDETGHDHGTPWDSANHFDGLFQLQVVPPMVVMTGVHHPQPAWQQLKGDLLFSVYHQEQAASSRSEFLGQASIPLHRLLHSLLGMSSAMPRAEMMQHFTLESRQGRPLSGGAEVVVRFQFEPDFPPVNRRPTTAITKQASSHELRQSISPQTARASATPSVASSKSRPQSAAASTRGGPTGGNPLRSRPHQSSSEINRRKFEKQLESENKALAKRMADQRREVGAIAARRQQLNQQPTLIKSEPKPGVVAVKTAPPRSHKASSAVNRSKYTDQIRQENRSMGKRLIERVGLGDRPQRVAGGDLKVWDTLDWDDAKAQDKAHVSDKRRVVRQEKDYQLEKAQAKYQQQNELVEHVMTLQTDVAEWKSKLFTVRSNLQRVDAMNTKDTHVRDCLQRATTKTKTMPAVPATPNSAHLEQVLGTDDEEDEDEDPTIRKHKRELRELFREAASFESEQRRLDDQLTDFSKREALLESEVVDLHRKWQFVQANRAFQTKMAADRDRANPTRAAYASHEMRAKKQALELSTEEEELYAIFQAQEQLTQLQIAATVLRDRIEKIATGSAHRPLSSSTCSSSSAACDYLREKITKRKAALESLEVQQSIVQRQYEALVVSGEYNKLRANAQELQHLLFLCQSEAKHVAAAERVAHHSKDKLVQDLQQQRFHEQTETDILLKRISRPF